MVKIIARDLPHYSEPCKGVHIQLINKFSFLEELCFNTLSVPDLLINVLENNKIIKNIKIMIVTINNALLDIISIEQLDVNDTIENFILLYLYCKEINININIPEQLNC